MKETLVMCFFACHQFNLEYTGFIDGGLCDCGEGFVNVYTGDYDEK